MSICGLEGSGFILSIGLTLLLSGIIVFLMNTKISRLEKNIHKTNDVLTNVITNIQTHLNMPQLSNEEELATPQAHAAAEKYMQQVSEEDYNKIIVSDNESRDSDSESDSDSDSDRESDRESENVEEKPSKVQVVECNDNICCIDLSNDKQSNEVSKKIVNLEKEELNLNNDLSDNSDSESDNSDSDREHPVVVIKDNNDLKDIVPVVSIDVPPPQQSSSVNINKLKVPELKKMVSSKGLASPNTTQNLKRKELVELLKD